MSEEVSGECIQVVSPRERYEYKLPDSTDVLLGSGYSISVIQIQDRPNILKRWWWHIRGNHPWVETVAMKNIQFGEGDTVNLDAEKCKIHHVDYIIDEQSQIDDFAKEGDEQ